MNIEHLPIPSLLPDPANARKHSKRNLDQIKASLLRFGQQKPIVVDATNVVRAGNGTLAAAVSLGWKTIAAVRSDLPAVELTAYAIVDNRSSELAEWDKPVLAATLSHAAIGDVGFNNAEIDRLLDKSIDEPPGVDTEPVRFLIIVTCESEQHQAELLGQFAEQELKCRAILG